MLIGDPSNPKAKLLLLKGKPLGKHGLFVMDCPPLIAAIMADFWATAFTGGWPWKGHGRV